MIECNFKQPQLVGKARCQLKRGCVFPCDGEEVCVIITGRLTMRSYTRRYGKSDELPSPDPDLSYFILRGG